MSARRALYILGVSLGLGLVFDLLFYGKLPGISFPIYMNLVLGVVLLAAHGFRTKIPKSAALVAGPFLFFSWMVFVRADGFITFLNVVASAYLLGLLIRMIFKPNLRNYVLLDYLKPLYKLPAEIWSKARDTFSAITTQRKTLGKYRLTPQVLRGILITVPIALLFVALFASADLVFRKYVSEIFDFKINDELIPRTFVVALVTVCFVGILGYLAQKSADSVASDKEFDSVDQPGSHGWGTIETTILFSSLNVLFLGFIILQLTYLFGGEQNIAGQGFTYAEYARKGFFELIAVAALAFVLITGAEKMLLQRNQKHALRFKILSGALVAQVMIVMVSAFNRLLLYENAYGFTTLRLYSHISLIWLAVIFCLLLYKIFRDQRESAFAFLAFGSVIVLLIGVNILSVDAFVARKNIDRFYATGKLDGEYLVSLSDDSIPETVKLLDTQDSKLRGNLAGALYRRYQANLTKGRHWQSANLSREAALRALESKKSFLEENKDKHIEKGYDTALSHAHSACQEYTAQGPTPSLDCSTLQVIHISQNRSPRVFDFTAGESPHSWSYFISLDQDGNVVGQQGRSPSGPLQKPIN